MAPMSNKPSSGARRTLVHLCLRFGFRHPWCALIGAFAIAALLIPGLPRLELRPSLEGLLQADMAMVTEYREFEANFGDTANQIIVARGNPLFTKTNLDRLQGLDQKLRTLHGIENVQSIFNVPVHREIESRSTVEPLLWLIPGSEDELEEVKAEALNSPILKGNFINAEATALAFVVSISDAPIREEGADDTVEAILNLVSEANSKWQPSLLVYELGLPTANAELLELISRDYYLLVPLAFLLVGACFFFFFRSWLAVLLPLLTGVLGIVGVLGFMGYAGIPINILLSTIILLVLILGCTEDLHLLSEYASCVESATPEDEIIDVIGASTGKALSLTALTTVLGFVSIAFTPLDSLREFATCAATGVALNFFFTILLSSALFRLFPPPKSFRDGSWNRGSRWFRHHILRAGRLPRRLVYGSFAIATLFFLAGAAQTNIDTDPYRFFPGDSRTLQNKSLLTEDFGGEFRFVVVVETGTRNGIHDQDTWDGLEQFQRWLESEFDGVLGFFDAMEEFFPAELPPGDDGNLSNSEAFEAVMHPVFVDFDQSRAAFYISSKNLSSSAMLDTEKRIQEKGQRLFPQDTRIMLTGERVLMAKLSDEVCRQLLINLGILAIVVAVIISVALGSWKLGLISIIPNLLPVVATLGIMGWLGVPFSVGTFPVTIIAFSIAVDDTIHLLTRAGLLSRLVQKPGQLWIRVVEEEIHPVLATSISISLGYLLLTLSKVRVNLEIGLLFTFAVGIALLADLFLTPCLLSRKVTGEEDRDIAA